jgi:hypothetical protein
MYFFFILDIKKVINKKNFCGCLFFWILAFASCFPLRRQPRAPGPLAIAFYLFEVSAKPRQNRNVFLPLGKAGPWRSRLLLGKAGPWRSLFRQSRPLAFAEGEGNLEEVFLPLGKAGTPYGVGRNEGEGNPVRGRSKDFTSCLPFGPWLSPSGKAQAKGTSFEVFPP